MSEPSRIMTVSLIAKLGLATLHLAVELQFLAIFL